MLCSFEHALGNIVRLEEAVVRNHNGNQNYIDFPVLFKVEVGIDDPFNRKVGVVQPARLTELGPSLILEND